MRGEAAANQRRELPPSPTYLVFNLISLSLSPSKFPSDSDVSSIGLTLPLLSFDLHVRVLYLASGNASQCYQIIQRIVHEKLFETFSIFSGLR